MNTQQKDTLSFLVTIKDKVNATGGDSEYDNLVEVPIKVIVVDENDNSPEFQNVSLFLLKYYLLSFFYSILSLLVYVGINFYM